MNPLNTTLRLVPGPEAVVEILFDDGDAPPGLVWYGRTFPAERRIQLNLPRLAQAAQRHGVDLEGLIVAVGIHERLHLKNPDASEEAVRRDTLAVLQRSGHGKAVAAFEAVVTGGFIGGLRRSS